VSTTTLINLKCVNLFCPAADVHIQFTIFTILPFPQLTTHRKATLKCLHTIWSGQSQQVQNLGMKMVSGKISLQILTAVADFVVQPKSDEEQRLPGTAANFQPHLKNEQHSVMQTSGMC